MSMKEKIKLFFGKSRQYAVCGASTNPAKFGYKISNWYVNHNLPVIPINPNLDVILSKSVAPSVTPILEGLKSGKDFKEHILSDKDGLSISFLTPPAITAQTLDEILSFVGYKDLIKGLWFQPGSYDQKVLDIATNLGLFHKVIFEDECILVRGEEGLYRANL